MFLNNSCIMEKRILSTGSQFQVMLKVPVINDHILASSPERVTQCGAIDICLSNHQCIYCSSKISSIKWGWHKQIQFCSFKYYTVGLFEEELSKLNVSNYQNHNKINEAYNDLIQKIMNAIGKGRSYKAKTSKTKLSRMVWWGNCWWN